MEYVFDAAIDAKWDHIEVTEVEQGHRMIYHCTDGTEIDYGPYDKDIYDRMVDDHVDHKYPFLKEPLKPENVDIDGAVTLLSQLMKDTKEVYIAQARNLKKHHFQIPTSSKEFKEYGISARAQKKLEGLRAILATIDKATEPERYEKMEAQIYQTERELGGIYRTIIFMEQGAAGAISVLKSDTNAQSIMRIWKQEAL